MKKDRDRPKQPTMPPAPPPIIRPRSEEVESLFALFAISQEVEASVKRLEKRLRVLPGAWRDIHMIDSVVLKLCAQILSTFPPEKRDAVQANARSMSYMVRFNKYGNLPGDKTYAAIAMDDLDAIVRFAHGWHCFACDKPCKACELGKALDHVMAQSRRKGESWGDIRLDEDHAAGEVVTECE